MNKLILSAMFALFIFSCAVKQRSFVKSGWSDKEKSDYMQECIKNFPASIKNTKAKDYCSCTLEKIQVKYPKPEDALKMEVKDMMDIAKECLQ